MLHLYYTICASLAHSDLLKKKGGLLASKKERGKSDWTFCSDIFLVWLQTKKLWCDCCKKYCIVCDFRDFLEGKERKFRPKLHSKFVFGKWEKLGWAGTFLRIFFQKLDFQKNRTHTHLTLVKMWWIWEKDWVFLFCLARNSVLKKNFDYYWEGLI